MDTAPKIPHAVGEVLNVIVEQVMPFGVFVTLDQHGEGYIRRRELTQSGDVDPQQIVRVGDSLTARVIQLALPDRRMELSVRQTQPDPWTEFGTEHKKGDIVEAVVKELRENEVIAEVRPGVRAQIAVDNLGAAPGKQPHEMVWPGDLVRAAIIQMDVAHYRLALSVNAYVSHSERMARILQQLKIAEETPTRWGQALPSDFSWTNIGRILVVDDDLSSRAETLASLRELRCDVEGCSRADAARVWGARAFRLLFVDMARGIGDGLAVLREARRTNPELLFVALGTAPQLAEASGALVEANAAYALGKPIVAEELRGFLQRVAGGERPSFSTDLLLPLDQSLAEVRRLAEIAQSRTPAAEKLAKIAERIFIETRACAAYVFHLDHASRQLTIVAQAGEELITAAGLRQLTSSPVRDVIVEGSIAKLYKASYDRSGRFTRLLEAATFQSCLGLPLRVAGSIEHALFLFSPEEGHFFSVERERIATMLSTLIVAALEREVLDRRLEEAGSLMAAGQAAAFLGHETSHVMALPGNLEHARKVLIGLAAAGRPLSGAELEDVLADLDTSISSAAGLTGFAQDFVDLVRVDTATSGGSRGQLSPRGQDHLQPADTNSIVLQTVRLLAGRARSARITLEATTSSEGAWALAANKNVLQALINLVVNAIQAIQRAPSERRRIHLTVAVVPADTHPVKIWCSDTGPGIHRRLWERIFDLGYSTRPGGSGLGLYIARRQIEAVGGRLRVAESFMMTGTTFVIELRADSAREA